ncbi:hypothetical protein [Brotaphodocola sp.]|uniref:hypothetical protein n=1 Tax=Brotaphodocola sp. TaxID=3073577 RepID=UPI003D7D0C71
MTEKEKKIYDALKKGVKKTREIMELCGVSCDTACWYRRKYMEEHPEEMTPELVYVPSTSEKEKRLRATAISAEKIAEVRKETRVGDTIPLRSLKISDDINGSGTNNGRATRGTVVSTKNRYFCVVRLPNGVMESVLWSDLVTGRGGTTK